MNSSDTLVRVYYLLPYSRTTGPGNRAVIWLRDSVPNNAKCPDVRGKETRTCQTLSGAYILGWIKTLGDSIEGITIAGSEPFDQCDAVLNLVQRIKAETSLSVILFTTLTLEDIGASECPDILMYIDVLVAGQDKSHDTASSPREVFPNKTIHIRTTCYNSEDMLALPQAEAVITPEGDMIVIGPDSLQW